METKKLVTKDAQRDIEDIKTCAAMLKSGGICVIPTETVYGLAADATNESAVKRIFEAKGRPGDNPLIVHISDISQLKNIVRVFPERAKKLASAFWPGPLTMILPKTDSIPFVTSGGLDTVAVRMPSNEVCRKIIELSCPLAAPSANISGFPSPTAFKYVEDDMSGRVDAICDGGDCTIGVESTVITLAQDVPTVLRPGRITPEQIEKVIGAIDISPACLEPLKAGETASSPGMKYKHYSPKADVTVVRGNADEFYEFVMASDCDGVLCFSEDASRYDFKDKKVVLLGSENDSLSQAKRLYDALRELDGLNLKNVFSRCPKKEGVGLAVCNRLFRAAAFSFKNAVKRKLIGLTGPTGAGKGTVAKHLESIGIAVIDTDKIARDLTKKGSPLLTELAEAFGADIIDEDGNLRRGLLASRAFINSAESAKLNGIMHPPILTESGKEAFDAFDCGAKAVALDAPLLFESGADKMCDIIIAVTAPKDLRLKRIMSRDALTIDEALERTDVQHPDAFYNDRADIVVRNYPPYEIKDELEGLKKLLGE